MSALFYFQSTLNICLTIVQSYVDIKLVLLEIWRVGDGGGVKLIPPEKTTIKKPSLIKVNIIHRKKQEDIESNFLFKNNYIDYSCSLYYSVLYKATAWYWIILLERNIETSKFRILLTLITKNLTKFLEDDINRKKTKALWM